MAVGRERFRADAGAVMAFMQQLAAAPMDADDPTQSYMLQVRAEQGVGDCQSEAWESMCCVCDQLCVFSISDAPMMYNVVRTDASTMELFSA
jgi:hypothetical protein